MDAPVAAAIVAGCASLISAFFAWQQAVRAKRIETKTQESLGRLTAETQVTVERIKYASENLKTILDLVIEESKPVEDVLLQMWQLIQYVKDKVTKVISHSESVGTLIVDEELEGIVKDIGIAQAEFVDLYLKYAGILSPEAIEIAHDAKKEIISPSSWLMIFMNDPKHEKVSEEHIIKVLTRGRESLSQLQAALINERSTFRKRRLQEHFGMMSSYAPESSKELEKRKDT